MSDLVDGQPPVAWPWPGHGLAMAGERHGSGRAAMVAGSSRAAGTEQVDPTVGGHAEGIGSASVATSTAAAMSTSMIAVISLV